MARLLLWDIDGTMLTASTVNRDALYAAASAVFEREIERFELDTPGKTDPQIVTDLLELMGVPQDEMQSTARKVIRKWGPEFAARRHEIAQVGELFAGVREVLEEIDKTRTINTVLTGNLAVNAIAKLDAFRLTRHFDLEIGGFGSDNPDRTQLVDVVLNRAADKRNKYFGDDDIWIIGDTPRDFAVAQANHTRCLLVANGRHPVEELAQLGADFVLPDLTDTQTVLDILLEPQPPAPESGTEETL